MTSKPNVVVILADQFRADCLSVAGHPDVRTPALDALAADGVRYENSFATAPLCAPSRHSLLTGLYPHQHGVHQNEGGLASDVTTLPETMREHGYSTVAVGKMHYTPTYMDAGFDHMVLAEQNGDGRLVDDYHRALMAAGLVDANDLIDQRTEYRSRANDEYAHTFGALVSDLPQEWHSSAWITDRALEHIDEDWVSGGNLMFLSYVKPHHPFDPPAPWDTAYQPSSLSILPGWTDEQVERDDWDGAYFDQSRLDELSLRNVMALYYGSISHLDHHIGRVVARLRELGIYEDTMIVFTADHGEYLGFHHMVLKHGLMYDPLIKVPLIVKYPAGHLRGSVDSRLTSGVDVYTTVLPAVGIDSSLDRPGIDLADSHASRSIVFAESSSSGQMLRSATHKTLTTADDRQCLLFDLEADPMELRPLGGELARNLGCEMRAWRDATLSFERRVSRAPLRGAIDTGRDVHHDATQMAQYLDSAIHESHPWLQPQHSGGVATTAPLAKK